MPNPCRRPIRIRTQPSEDAARPQRIADGLVDAILPGNPDLVLEGFGAADVDHVEDVVGTSKGLPAIGRRLDRGVGVAVLDHGPTASVVFASRPSSTSINLLLPSASSGNERRSPIGFLAKTVLPAPMSTIVGRYPLSCG